MSAHRVVHPTERWDVTVDIGYEEMLEKFERLVPPADIAAFAAARTWDESLSAGDPSSNTAAGVPGVGRPENTVAAAVRFGG